MVDAHDADAHAFQDRLIAEQECRSITSLPRGTRWRLIRDGRFPPPVQVSPGRIAWRLSALMRWMDERPMTSASATAAQHRDHAHTVEAQHA